MCGSLLLFIHLMAKRLLAFVLVGLLLGFSPAYQVQAAQEAYVGDAQCKKCHADIYKTYRKTGHPYKIQKIEGGPPVYPSGTSPGVPAPPEGISWDDISYIIGGFAWKARFMDKEGYILTGDANRQYNIPNPHIETPAGWTGYSASTAPRKPYTCGSCHTTGWVASGPDGPHQDDLPGIHGTWAAPGVTCEGCHGPGGGHSEEPEKIKLSYGEQCGDCHSRGDVSKIDVSNGLIRHHEQYEDLLASPHRYIKCTACHDPHKSVKYDSGGFKGAEQTCLTCHADQEVKIAAKAKFECVTCHMPRVAKSAVSVKHDFVDGSVAEGDIRGHIFRINTDPRWNMIDDDGKYVRLDDDGKAHLSVESACMSCHTDKEKAWAIENASAIHGDK